MSLNSSYSPEKSISEIKLCEFPGVDELIEKAVFKVKRASGKNGKDQVPAEYIPELFFEEKIQKRNPEKTASPKQNT